ncbi:MAG: DUF4433 domain-containing protein [Cyanobacteria bacterium J06559_3]
MTVPTQPKIYHIVHVDRLPSIIADGYLWCDAEVVRRAPVGTTIGMNHIKQRRLNELTLTSYPKLNVGDCVPFYFCPRSIMLYLIYRGNDPSLTYRGGQGPIIHLQADLHNCVDWANRNDRRWAFTLSNAGAYYFEDRCNLAQLSEIKWQAVGTNRWSGSGISSSIKEGKQAEFLLEHCFPWHLIERIGVHSRVIYQKVANVLPVGGHRPEVEIKADWYY